MNNRHKSTPRKDIDRARAIAKAEIGGSAMHPKPTCSVVSSGEGSVIVTVDHRKLDQPMAGIEAMNNLGKPGISATDHLRNTNNHINAILVRIAAGNLIEMVEAEIKLHVKDAIKLGDTRQGDAAIKRALDSFAQYDWFLAVESGADMANEGDSMVMSEALEEIGFSGEESDLFFELRDQMWDAERKSDNRS